VLDAAVDASARPDGAAVPDAAAYGVYPLIILIVYVLVTGGVLCSSQSEVYLTTPGTLGSLGLYGTGRDSGCNKVFL